MTETLNHVFKIQRYSIHDGPGIRTTLFFQGCPLACQWCHNPESQALAGKIDSASLAGIVRELLEQIEKDNIFYDESGGGVTFSGGEPLHQPELLVSLITACKEKKIHTCLDTCGFAPFEILEQAAVKADLILYDIKLFDDSVHQKFTGKPVGPVLENLEKLSAMHADLWLRFPMIPGITDNDENISQIIEFLLEKTIYRNIHILPFHNTGEKKYEVLNRKNYLKNIKPPCEARIAQIVQMFESKGFKTIIGG